MRRTVDMRQASQPLEATYSRAEVMAHLGCKATQLWLLMKLGRQAHGRHPLKGGLWPWFRPSHKCVRITASAIESHKRHMERLDTDAAYAAEMRVKARDLGLGKAA
jgi:hypothetical protein